MKDSTDHTLNGGGVIAEHHKSILFKVIHTIRRGIASRKSTNGILDPLLLGPHICFAPSNCFAYDGPNLTNTKI